jgi:hypothetical protein
MKRLFMAWCTTLFAAVLAASAGAAVDRTASAVGSHDIAVGGGQMFSLCGDPTTPMNFALSAHVPTGTPPVSGGAEQPGAGGTFNATIPESARPSCQPGRLVAKVDCLVVAANPSGGGIADVTARIVEATGTFRFAFGPPGGHVYIQAVDGGSEDGDAIDIRSALPEPCDFFSPFPRPLERGNLIVRSGA